MLLRLSSLPFFWLAFFVAVPLASAKTKDVEIYLYPSYATSQGLLVTGHVLRFSDTIRKGRESSSSGRTFRSMLRRFTRKASPFASLSIHVGQQKQTVSADKDGFFQASFPSIRPPVSTSDPTSQPASQPAKHPPTDPHAEPPRRSAVWPVWMQAPEDTSGLLPIRVHLLSQNLRSIPAETPSFAVIPTSNHGVSVVTDLDDTLIETNVVRKLQMIRTVFFRSPAEIVVIPGALDFLRSLLEGPKKQGGGVLHYVSGSPTDLFDRISHLFALRGFPLGSLTLKPISGTGSYPLKEQIRYKLEKIQAILQAYPQRHFVLIGDSGEKDPLIYYRLRLLFPRQVRAIFIRQVQDTLPPQAQYPGIFYFRTYQDAFLEAKKLGLLP